MSQSIDIRTQTYGAVLDSAHLGDIEGALGTIYQHDRRPRSTWKRRLATLLAIIGPGLIVMVGDNDAGAFATYTQAGQNYGTTLLWSLLLLVPVLAAACTGGNSTTPVDPTPNPCPNPPCSTTPRTSGTLSRFGCIVGRLGLVGWTRRRRACRTRRTRAWRPGISL